MRGARGVRHGKAEMLAVVASAGSKLDAGSMGLALARRWSDASEQVLFVDADTTGSRLAERFGAATRAEYSPAVRGMPSLIVARVPLNLKTLADHCYRLDGSQGLLWALYAPFNVVACLYAARWLAERTGDLAAVDRQRPVVVSTSLRSGGTHLAPLLGSCAVVVVLAPVPTLESAKALWEECRAAGLMGFDRGHRLIVVEGSSPLEDDEIRAEAGMHVAGRLPVVEAERLLRAQSGRRDRSLTRELDGIIMKVRSLLNLEDDAVFGGAAGLDGGVRSDGRSARPDPRGSIPSRRAGVASPVVGVPPRPLNGERTAFETALEPVRGEQGS